MEHISPEVSVIVPTFNRMELLRETIESILSQTFNDFELLIIDNMSEDGTEKYVTNLKDGRIRYFKNDNKGIIAVNRNLGISHSRGKYIAFCDDDDLWTKDKLRDQVTVLNEDKDLIFVYSMALAIGNVSFMSPYYGLIPLPFRAVRDKKALINGNTICCSSMLARTDVIKKVGGFDDDPKLKTVEDYDLWLRISEFGPFRFMAKIHLLYRINPKGESRNIEIHEERWRYLLNKRNICQKRQKLHKTRGFPELMVRNIVHALFLTMYRIREKTLAA